MMGKFANKGFSLIEVLVTLVIVSVGMLAVGSFYISSINSQNASLKRLAAVHLAEQMIESWQNTDVFPTPDCTLVTTGNPAGQLVLKATITCIPNIGVQSPFDIFIDEADAEAPVPNGHVSHPTRGALDAPQKGTLLTGAGAAVKLRKVKVSWKFQTRDYSVLLTHITRKPTGP